MDSWVKHITLREDNNQNKHSNYIYEELVSKTSYIHPDMLLIYIIDFLLQFK